MGKKAQWVKKQLFSDDKTVGRAFGALAGGVAGGALTGGVGTIPGGMAGMALGQAAGLSGIGKGLKKGDEVMKKSGEAIRRRIAGAIKRNT